MAPGSVARMAVVEHVAHHLLAGRDQAQRARGRHAEVVHRLAAQELANRRAQHRAAVGACASTACGPAPLSCSSQRSPAALTSFAQRDRAAVAELPGPVAELVPAVVRRDTAACRAAARCRRTPGRTPGDATSASLNPSALGHFARMRHQPRRRHRRRARRASTTPPCTWRIRGPVSGSPGSSRTNALSNRGCMAMSRCAATAVDECIRVSPHGVEHGNARDAWATRSFIWR